MQYLLKVFGYISNIPKNLKGTYAYKHLQVFFNMYRATHD